MEGQEACEVPKKGREKDGFTKLRGQGSRKSRSYLGDPAAKEKLDRSNWLMFVLRSTFDTV